MKGLLFHSITWSIYQCQPIAKGNSSSEQKERKKVHEDGNLSIFPFFIWVARDSNPELIGWSRSSFFIARKKPLPKSCLHFSLHTTFPMYTSNTSIWNKYQKVYYSMDSTTTAWAFQKNNEPISFDLSNMFRFFLFYLHSLIPNQEWLTKSLIRRISKYQIRSL
jgi:hypothetical protein